MTPRGFRATLPAMHPLDRIALSRRVITGWEAIGKPGGRPADSLLMIRDELAALAEIGRSEAGYHDDVAALTERYRVMAMKIRLSTH